MVMEESNIHHHSPTGENANSNSNVYLVGLEFVRQYYTVLNQGPLYLHRFYSDDSSFVHGVSARDLKVAYGQQEIHKRIQALNFHNCHAKIRQVDSHETLGNGVVIQVTGELSNNGQPMRRFMQTFVLAPQSPKRYYVRNDIFHYQDEVFCDDENEPSTPVESSLDQEEQDENEKEVDVNGGSNVSLPPVVSTPPIAAVTVPKTSPSTAEPVHVIVSHGQPSPAISLEIKPEVVSQAKPDTTPPAHGALIGSGDDGPLNIGRVTSALEEDHPPSTTAGGSGPKTYANLFKSSGINNSSGPHTAVTQSGSTAAKGTNGPSGGSPGNSNVSVNVNEAGVTSPPQVSPQPAFTGGAGGKGLPPRNPRGPAYGRDRGDRDRPPVDRDPRERRERLSSRSSTALNDETGSIDGDRRRPVNTYPDTHQLFVGNLPHTVTVTDMKEIFSEFGEVAEVKIQKPLPKNSGVKVPYFCFVVFEDAASAQAAIQKKVNQGDIYMKIANGSQRRLNVEQKRSHRTQGRQGGEDTEASFNRVEASSPAAGRPADGSRNNVRTYRGSNRGGSGAGGERGGGGRGGGERGGGSGRGGSDRGDRGGSGRGAGGGNKL